MDTNLMQHKSVLFLISLSQNKIHEIEEKGVDYQLFLRTIRAYSHVEVHETISEDLISTASLYEVVVIVGHQVDGCIEMGDGSLFPMAKIASALHRYTGYIHVAVCGSSSIRDAIKQCSPDSRLRTSKVSTQLELQLLLYSLLLSRTDLNKDTFDYWYEFEWNFIKEIQERKDPADLAKLPCATKLGEESSENVKTTVYSPLNVVRGECFSILIAMHFDADNGKLFVDRRRNDPNLKGEEPREHNVVMNNVHYGDKLSIKMGFEDATKHLTDLIWINNDDNPKLVTISDKIELEFVVFVDAGYPYSYFKTILEYIKDGRCIRMFDYHYYRVVSVSPQYDYYSERRQGDTGGNHNKLVRPVELFSLSTGQIKLNTENDNWKSLTIEERIKQAIQKVKEEKHIKYAYDYAFIMQKMNETDDMPTFRTPNTFLTYLEMIGIENLPKIDSLKKILSVITGVHPWKFKDDKGKSGAEALRRNNIAKRFYVLFMKGH